MYQGYAYDYVQELDMGSLYARRHNHATPAFDGYRPHPTPLYRLSCFVNDSLDCIALAL
jgi:hypothetical protein